MIATTNAFGQTDTLSLKEYLFPRSFEIVQQVISSRTDFYLLEFECTGGAFLNPADSCFERTSYVMTSKTNSQIDLTKFDICKQSATGQIHSDKLNYFETNKDKIRKEEFKVKVISLHDCGIWFYEFKDKKLKTVLHFSDFMIDENKQFEKANKELLTYKLLMGLKDEIKRFENITTR